MAAAADKSGDVGAVARRLAQGVLAIAHTRLELLVVEAQEERERMLRAILLALGAAAFGLLAGITLTLLLVVLLWERSPAITLAALTVAYSLAGTFLYLRLARLQREWRMFSSTLEQLQKDRACLEKALL